MCVGGPDLKVSCSPWWLSPLFTEAGPASQFAVSTWHIPALNGSSFMNSVDPNSRELALASALFPRASTANSLLAGNDLELLIFLLLPLQCWDYWHESPNPTTRSAEPETWLRACWASTLLNELRLSCCFFVSIALKLCSYRNSTRGRGGGSRQGFSVWLLLSWNSVGQSNSEILLPLAPEFWHQRRELPPPGLPRILLHFHKDSILNTPGD